MAELDALLELEARSGLWEREAGGIHLWPLIRTAVLMQALLQARGRAPTQNWRQRLTRLARQPAKHARTLGFLVNPQPRPYSALFFKPGSDRLQQYYFSGLPAPLVVEASYNGQNDEAIWRDGTPILLEDTLKVGFQLGSPFMRLPHPTQQAVMDTGREAAALYHLGDAAQQFAPLMTRFIKRYYLWSAFTARYLEKRVSSRLAVINAASYMGGIAPLVRALHEAGFTVAEPQHGMIGLAHAPYNFPPAWVHDPAHPLRSYMPDVLLTFGAYWSQQVRTPARTVEIGFPPLAAGVERLAGVSANPQQILVISQWTITEQLVAMARALAQSFPDYTVVYKLHPAESRTDPRFAPLDGLPNLQISWGTNIHDLIAASGVIVGYNSTVLFEALAFPRRRIFLLDQKPFSDAIPAELGMKFADTGALLEALRQPDTGYPTADPHYIWADQWRAGITAFLNDYLPQP